MTTEKSHSEQRTDKGVLIDLPMVIIDCKDIVIKDNFRDSLNFVKKINKLKHFRSHQEAFFDIFLQTGRVNRLKPLT